MAKGKFVQTLVKTAEKAGLLDMSDAARMARARELGFDTDAVFRHESPSPEQITEIKPPTKYGDRNFGGIFSLEGNRAGYYDNVQDFVVRDGVADNSELSRYARENYDEVEKFIKEKVGNDVSEDEIDEIIDFAATGDDWPLEGSDKFERYSELFRAYDTPDMFVEMQRIRGELARKAGYGAVTQADEFGESIMLLPGSKVRSINAAFDPAKKESPNLLASILPAAAGVGGTAAMLGQSESAEAMPEPKGRFARSLMDTYLKQQVAKPMSPDERLQYGQGFGTQDKIEPVQNEWAAKAAEYSDKYNKWRRANVHPIADLALPVGELPADALRKMSYGDKITYMDSVMAGLGML